MSRNRLQYSPQLTGLHRHSPPCCPGPQLVLNNYALQFHGQPFGPDSCCGPSAPRIFVFWPGPSIPPAAPRSPAARFSGKLSREAFLTCHKCLLPAPPSVAIITHWPASTIPTNQGEQLSTAVDIAVYKPLLSQRKTSFLLFGNLMILRILSPQSNQAQWKGLCIRVLFSTFPYAFLSALQVFSSLPKRDVKSIG